jgi:hypothetical protein
MSAWRLSARATELEQRQDHSTSKSLYIQQCGDGSPLLMNVDDGTARASRENSVMETT